MTTPFDPATAAAMFAGAMTSGTFITEIPEAQRPRTIAEGYDVQDQLAVELTNGHALRDTTAGWKLGLGSANAMKGAKIDRPLMGRVFQGRLHDDDVLVPATDGATALIEIELAVTLSRDIAPGDQVANPLDALASANLVSEIVLSRFEIRGAKLKKGTAVLI